MKFIIAIDPGASGGIASLQGAGHCISMPKTQGDILCELRFLKHKANMSGMDSICYLEEVGGFTGKGQPGSAMFKFGAGWGFIQGCLMSLDIPTVLVRPQKWQKFFSLGTASGCASKTEWKNKLRAEAQRRHPNLKVTLAVSDALLILDYAIHMEKGAQ